MIKKERILSQKSFPFLLRKHVRIYIYKYNTKNEKNLINYANKFFVNFIKTAYLSHFLYIA